MNNPLNEEQANAVYDVLEQCVGANAFQRTDFIAAQREECQEYRFQGYLGFGGKFKNFKYDDKWHVDCYPEDETPERRQMMDHANKILKALREKLA